MNMNSDELLRNLMVMTCQPDEERTERFALNVLWRELGHVRVGISPATRGDPRYMPMIRHIVDRNLPEARFRTKHEKLIAEFVEKNS